VLFPDFTVSSDGEVKSILLLSRLPVEKLSGRTVALTTTSATSHVLLKLILSRKYGVNPDYVSCPPDLDKMFAIADASLLIGDIALKYSFHNEDFYSYDLGIEWKQLTGKKMVYAVWAVRRNFNRTRSELCENVFETFRRSMDYSLEHIDEIVEYATKWEPFSRSFLADYFRCLRFDFGKDYQEGLLHFYGMAKEIGELEIVPEPEFINLHSGVKT
jgi:chorismate dehydratase